MNVGCNLFGVAASSRVPVKRYNELVPDVFPKIAPPFDEELDPGLTRKIEKLGEYLKKNKHRIEKVSRRLARKINKELASHKYGHVKLAVCTYTHLFEVLDRRSYGFHKELIKEPVDLQKKWYNIKGEPYEYSVVGSLLHHRCAEIRVLGAELLTAFIKAQATEQLAEQIEVLIREYVCMDAAERQLESISPRAPPAGIANALNVASLTTMEAFLRYTYRVHTKHRGLDSITRTVLAILRHPEVYGPLPRPTGELPTSSHAGPRPTADQPGEGLQAGPVAGSAAPIPAPSGTIAPGEPQVTTPAGIEELSLDDDGQAPPASPPKLPTEKAAEVLALAVTVLKKDMVAAKEVLEIIVGYLEEQQCWGDSGALYRDLVLGIALEACRESEQPFLLLVVLLQLATHPRQPPLSLATRTAVLAVMEQYNPRVDPDPEAGHVPTVIFSLEEFFRMLPPAEAQGEAAQLRAMLLGCLARLARQVESSYLLAWALAESVCILPEPGGLCTAKLDCLRVAAAVVAELPQMEGVAGPYPAMPLQLLLGIMTQWPPQCRGAVHELLVALLPSMTDLEEGQAHAVLSAVWHEAAAVDNPPAAFPAMFSAAAAAMHHGPPLATLQAAALAVRLRAEGAAAEAGRLDELSPARCLAVVAMANGLLALVAARLELGSLLKLGAELGGACRHLRVTHTGLELVAGSGDFTAADDAAAAVALTAMRAASPSAADLAASFRQLAAALERHPLWAEAGLTNGDLHAKLAQPFEPLPLQELLPADAPPFTGDWVAKLSAGRVSGAGNGLRAKMVEVPPPEPPKPRTVKDVLTDVEQQQAPQPAPPAPSTKPKRSFAAAAGRHAARSQSVSQLLQGVGPKPDGAHKLGADAGVKSGADAGSKLGANAAPDSLLGELLGPQPFRLATKVNPVTTLYDVDTAPQGGPFDPLKGFTDVPMAPQQKLEELLGQPRSKAWDPVAPGLEVSGTGTGDGAWERMRAEREARHAERKEVKRQEIARVRAKQAEDQANWFPRYVQHVLKQLDEAEADGGAAAAAEPSWEAKIGGIPEYPPDFAEYCMPRWLWGGQLAPEQAESGSKGSGSSSATRPAADKSSAAAAAGPSMSQGTADEDAFFDAVSRMPSMAAAPAAAAAAAGAGTSKGGSEPMANGWHEQAAPPQTRRDWTASLDPNEPPAERPKSPMVEPTPKPAFGGMLENIDNFSVSSDDSEELEL